MHEFTESLVGCVLTFALHSTVWLLLAFCAAWLLRRHDALVESTWRVALFGSVVTTLIQPWLGFATLPPLLESVALPEAGRAAMDAAPVMAMSESTSLVPSLAVSDYVALAAFGYVFVVGLLLVRQVLAWCAFHRSVADREEIVDPRIRGILAAVQLRAGVEREVRLTRSKRLSGPVGFGFGRPEICLPAVMLTGMPAAQLRCVLAHELAHVRDRDTWWLTAYEAMACLAFFQPLVYCARRRLRDAAEFRCDTAAVAWSGDRVLLARTLVEVAETLTAPHAARLATPMAHRDSALVGRVRRILTEDVARTSGARRLYLGLALAMTVAGTALPGVDLSGEPPRAAAVGIPGELLRLEREIADLHAGLATTWRLLEGRDLPQVSVTVRAMQQRLREMTDEHAALWRAAHEIPSAPGKPERTNNETSERMK